MARRPEENEELYEEGYEEEPYDDEEEEEGIASPGWLGDAPWWAVSAVLHGLILLLIGGYVLTDTRGEKKKTTNTVMKRKYEPPPYDPTKKRDMHRKADTLRDTDKKLIKQLKPDEITTDIPKGTSFDNMSNKELDHTGAVDVFGVGGGASGAYGSRFGRGSLVSEGGSPGTEEAVRAALEWLKRHQASDGRWSCNDFIKQCDAKKGPCTNLKKSMDYLNTGGRGWKEHDIGVTALSMLAYTGYGHTHEGGKFPEYINVLKKALKFIKSVQITGMNNPNYDGCFRFKDTIPKDKSKEEEIDEKQQWMYDHAIATMAVAELLLMSGDFLHLKQTVEDAAMFCIRAQNDDWGWRYSVKSPDNDTSVTGWMVLALKTVKVCRDLELISKPSKDELERSFQGALHWFDHATSDATGVTGYLSPGDEGSRLFELDELDEGYPYSKNLSCMTAVSVLCRLFAGEKRSNEVIKRSVGQLMKHMPEWKPRDGNKLSTINVYYWYYGTFAMFQFGGAYWRKWNDEMQDSLLKTQRQVGDDAGGCEDGSWDPIGEWGAAGGRVYSTAMGALTLEVYYRYERAKGGQGF